MFGFQPAEKLRQAEALLEAIGRSQAIIHFKPDGTVLWANKNFLETMQYSLDEIVGRHHRIFMPAEDRDSETYLEFWRALQRGEFQTGMYNRVSKSGREIWLRAAYSPVLDNAGKVEKVVKVAADITDQVLKDADYAGQVAAISKSQAVIEFDLDGTIRTANDAFLQAMGYGLSEIQGKHHRIFMPADQRDSAEYKAFWKKLGQGEFDSGEYKRIANGGREVWIKASYNPIFDRKGRPFKVVKYATDVTAEKLRNADVVGQIEAIGKAQAVIEFNLDGTIITANPNFLSAMGYTLDEVKGRHHRMFMPAGQGETPEYAAFWEKLGRGEYQAGQFLRAAKGGEEVWIQASYNPILDLNGRPFKVVKYASDVTEQVRARKRAEHVGSLLESVAAGAEELNASVREISDSMGRSKETTTSAFDLVVATDESASELGASTKSLSHILEVIDNITGQINLLALNATIESARAGEAGKGFAVVANEVKNLANQAKNATQQIAERIDNMETVSGHVVGSLSQIRSAMEQVLEYVASTATAVEEQSAVANDMSSTIQKAADEARAM